MRLPKPPRQLRVIGFDDAPFVRRRGARVDLAGVVCRGTRFEGLLWGRTRKDGWQATERVIEMLRGSKYLPQVHLVLLDGIAFGGLNVVDLPRLSEAIERPCVAVMRRLPDLVAMERAIRTLSRPELRLERLRRAGPIHRRGVFVFQVCGMDPDVTHQALLRLTDTGNVPEALRLAHLIASAVRDGESRGRA
ncbi:endonuclease dU [Paraliomyxa miuraensis]|uniref:endonuclease dU n=1 Tax=Paraliomyxa miuraensis TaxID=376150 RepID=UPI00225447DC|nr:DUF99 family protein [Paraliomyxa miuraensis]MCX4242877.1 DUF99 family protein [Paraliomyxa miuraensis]